MAGVEILEKDRMRLDSEATLDDICAVTDRLRLPVEPMCRRKPIVQFLREGGYGYGSLEEGSLAGKILRVSWECRGRSYSYGLEASTLYNAGYPLHRIVDMARSEILGMDLGSIESVTCLAVESADETACYFDTGAASLKIPDAATNAVFVNDRAAALFGLPGRGLLATFRARTGSAGEEVKRAWERRFIEDSLPAGLSALRMLTVKSNLELLVKAAGPASSCVVLSTVKGFVVNIHCERDVRDAVMRDIRSMKHTYLIHCSD